MSLDSAKQFLSKLDLDADFYRQVGEASSPQARWELLRGLGFDFNKGELTQAMGDLDAQRMTRLFLTSWARVFGDIPRPESTGPGVACGTCE